MRRIPLLAAPIAAFAVSAFAGGLDEAKQYLEQAAPLHCELLTMMYQAQSLEGDSPGRDALMTQLYKRAADVEREMAPAVRQFETAQAMLTAVERGQLHRYSSALLKECSSKAAETYRVRIPMATAEPAPPRAMLYVPQREKSSEAAAQPSAIQGASVEP